MVTDGLSGTQRYRPGQPAVATTNFDRRQVVSRRGRVVPAHPRQDQGSW